jgi:outer membrane protein assembly factor BamB
VIWQRDLDGEYQVEMPTWGLAASPLIEGDLLILQIGGAGGACMVALDKLTGKERWRALDDRASYSAPIVIDHAGRRLLVVWTGDHVAGLDPRTGEIHWQVDFPPKRMPMGIATPVHHQNYVFVSGFFDGSLLLQLEPDRPAVREIWRRCGPNERETDSLQSIISTPILRDGHIYGVDSFGELRCLDLLTGDRVWTSLDAVPQARWATIHFVENGDRTWMFNERGELLISRLTPQGFNEISRAKLIEPTTGQLPQRGGVCWSHPAFANRCIFARNDQELVCASLAAPAGAAASGAASPDAAAALQPAPAALDQAALERRFTETLAEAVFEGSWQMTAMKPGVPQVLGEVRTDRYSISKVSKVTGDRWLIFARIQYGEHDVTIPVPVRVVWAGDTPVITLDEMALPGLGTYSARVMVYRDFYSGTWFGSSYGGVMSGRITRGAAGAAPATKQPDAPGASGAAGSESD